MKFQIGDVVELNSGGERMTVESISDGFVDCVCFEGGKFTRLTLDPVILKKIQPNPTIL